MAENAPQCSGYQRDPRRHKAASIALNTHHATQQVIEINRRIILRQGISSGNAVLPDCNQSMQTKAALVQCERNIAGTESDIRRSLDCDDVARPQRRQHAATKYPQPDTAARPQGRLYQR